MGDGRRRGWVRGPEGTLVQEIHGGIHLDVMVPVQFSEKETGIRQQTLP